MLTVPRWRLIVVVIVALWAIVFALPNVLPESVRQSIPVLKDLRVLNLGLDLRGGSHLLLEVDEKALLKQELENVVDEMAQTLRDAEPRPSITGRGVVGDVARLRVVNAADAPRALQLIEKEVNLPIETGSFGRTAKRLTVTAGAEGLIEARLTKDHSEQLIRRAVTQSIEVIRRRIDPNGTSEVSIARQGANRVVVQAPGEQDPESLKRRIGTTARMTFHLVDGSVGFEEIAAGRAPPGTRILPSSEAGRPPVAVRNRVYLSGEDLSRATATFDPNTGVPAVSLRFNSRGARIFGQITTQNVNKPFAIVLDDYVLTAPNINEPILGGSAQISGGFADVAEAQELATMLNAGALPAPLAILEQRSVGPGLGQDAIEAGAIAGALAGVGVLLFMVVTYGFTFGLIAVAALVVNLVMIVAAMSTVNAALTLPGIAGLILTAAMAVDANVLIYERMREETIAGKTPALAIDAGFNRAMITIVDANLTTILAAVVLFVTAGAGPVRGFAWTLTIGVITSVFTAVLITQILLAWWFRSARPKKLPI